MGAGHLEALIVVPTGGWSCDIVGTSSFTVTIPAGNYYWNGRSPVTELTAGVESLRNNFRDQLIAVSNLYTFSMGSDGAMTLSRGFGTVGVTWTDTELRDLCGWDADFGATFSATAPEQVEAVWLPDCPVQTLHYAVDTNFDEFRGRLESDFISVEHQSGLSKVFAGSSAYVRDFTWPLISRAKVWESHAVLPNASWERFYEGAICGRYPWAKPGGPVRWHSTQEFKLTYPNASDSPSQYKIPPASVPSPTPATGGYNGMWRIEIPRAILIPALKDATGS